MAAIMNGVSLPYAQGSCVISDNQADFGIYEDKAIRLNRHSWMLELPGPAVRGPEQTELLLGSNHDTVFRFVQEHLPKWRGNEGNVFSNDQVGGDAAVEYEAFVGNLLLRVQEFEEFYTSIGKYEDVKNQHRRKYVPRTVTWPAILRCFIPFADNDMASRGLIVKHAERMQPYLRDIRNGPKRLLQRIHQQSSMDRIQELDMHCLIDYARRPGKTAAEKGGARQRLLAVERRETFDTLENRVVLDFCRRSLFACRSYLEQNRKIQLQDSKRMQTVRRYQYFLHAYLADMIWKDVKPLAEPCRTPNYALAQNPLYVEIWKGYLDLLRHADLLEQIWRWPRRLWADLVRVLINEAARMTFEHDMEALPLANRPICAAKAMANARMFITSSYVGGWRLNRASGAGCLYLLDQSDIADFFQNSSALERCCADCYWVWLPDDATQQSSVVPIWAMVGDLQWDSRDSNDLIVSWCGELEDAMKQMKWPQHIRIAGAAIIRANWTSETNRAENLGTSALPLWFIETHARGNWSEGEVRSLLKPLGSLFS